MFYSIGVLIQGRGRRAIFRIMTVIVCFCCLSFAMLSRYFFRKNVCRSFKRKDLIKYSFSNFNSSALGGKIYGSKLEENIKVSPDVELRRII